MKTYQKLDDNIFKYLDDNEIVEFLSNNESLKDIFNEMQESEMACVVSLVFIINPNDFELVLNIIVKHERVDAFGQYEYYLIPDFVNKKTNLFDLLSALKIATNAEPDGILNSIGEQVTEIHFQTSYHESPFLEANETQIYFGLTKS